jgi:hypothetical protein
MLQNIIPSNPNDFQHALLSSPPVAKVFHTRARTHTHTKDIPQALLLAPLIS